jgi:hypothetical protein
MKTRPEEMTPEIWLWTERDKVRRKERPEVEMAAAK